MNATELDHFRTHGYLKLPDFHARSRMQALKARLLDELRRLGVWAGGKALPHAMRQLPPFQQITRLSSSIQWPQLHEQLAGPALRALVVELAGHEPHGVNATQLLLSLPHRGSWTSQPLNWHVDVTARPPQRLPGIQAFHLIDDVAPQGGATLGLVGSHMPGAVTQEVRDQLDPGQAVNPAQLVLPVIEMCGRAGDLFLMDMRMLHTPSLNTAKTPRMMATTRFLF